jgi:hypothetical protein
MKKITLVLLVVFISMASIAYGNETLKPIRAELSIGSPNLIGLSGEYVLGDMLPNVSIDSDFSYIPIPADETTTITLSYLSLGGRYYLRDYVKVGNEGLGEGVYVGGGLGRLGIKLTFTQDEDSISEDEIDGVVYKEASGSLAANFLIVKAGYRRRFGILTFNSELGYGLGKLDNKVEYSIIDHAGNETEGKEEVPDEDMPPIGVGTSAKVSVGLAF